MHTHTAAGESESVRLLGRVIKKRRGEGRWRAAQAFIRGTSFSAFELTVVDKKNQNPESRMT